MNADMFGYAPPPATVPGHPQPTRLSSGRKSNALPATGSALPQGAAKHLQRQCEAGSGMEAQPGAREEGSGKQALKRCGTDQRNRADAELRMKQIDVCVNPALMPPMFEFYPEAWYAEQCNKAGIPLFGRSLAEGVHRGVLSRTTLEGGSLLFRWTAPEGCYFADMGDAARKAAA